MQIAGLLQPDIDPLQLAAMPHARLRCDARKHIGIARVGFTSVYAERCGHLSQTCKAGEIRASSAPVRKTNSAHVLSNQALRMFSLRHYPFV